MEKKITIQIKSNYGQEAIYPVCDDAVTFTRLTGKKTLSRGDLTFIRALGYDVAVQQTAL